MADGDRPPGDDLPLTPEDVEEIVAILSGSTYETLDIETARFRLRVARSGDGWTQEWSPVGADAPVAPAAVELPEPADAPDDGLLVIRPPLPGTFYRAPQPGAPPFVEVGARVAPDTVVAIVETMKLMTPVHAGVAGEIVEISVQNGEPIDADSVLMRVKAL
jgi:acetyl-CoA carboxylase biotin carboxyl carrier protein